MEGATGDWTTRRSCRIAVNAATHRSDPTCRTPARYSYRLIQNFIEGMTSMSNVVNYFEVGTPDPGATSAFYSGLFGWQIGDSGDYRAINGDKGGVWDTSAIGGGSYAIFYVQVDDVQAVIEKASGLGAQVVVPYTDNGPIEFAHLQDPQGNRFGVWRPKG
jgi:uncharacterized protein